MYLDMSVSTLTYRIYFKEFAHVTVEADKSKIQASVDVVSSPKAV